MAEPNDEWRWNRLRETLTVLAAEPVEQLAWIGGAHMDELALDFDDARQAAVGAASRPQLVSDELLELVETIDSELDGMSGPSNAGLWTPHALRESDSWALVRELARRAVALWPGHA